MWVQIKILLCVEVYFIHLCKLFVINFVISLSVYMLNQIPNVFHRYRVHFCPANEPIDQSTLLVSAFIQTTGSLIHRKEKKLVTRQYRY